MKIMFDSILGIYFGNQCGGGVLQIGLWGPLFLPRSNCVMTYVIFRLTYKYNYFVFLCPAIASLGLAAVVVSVVRVYLLNTIASEHVIKAGILSRLVLHSFGFVTS